MPRCARIKFDNAIFHIMIRSISEVLLFKNNSDKDMYLSFVKYYQKIYHFKVYSYCLMSNHAHFIIDSNGADISKIMHSLNFRYATNFNNKYKRHGHLFQDRFKSKIINNENYLIKASAYIHRNPIDIKNYANCPEKYKYSSLGIYLGLKKDSFKILDKHFIKNVFNFSCEKSIKKYLNLVYIYNDKKFKDEIEFNNDITFYKSERTSLCKNITPDTIVNYLSLKLNISKLTFYMKNNSNSTTARSLAILMMRGLCNLRCKDICSILGNITESRVSSLCKSAINLISTNSNYNNLINEFITFN